MVGRTFLCYLSSQSSLNLLHNLAKGKFVLLRTVPIPNLYIYVEIFAIQFPRTQLWTCHPAAVIGKSLSIAETLVRGTLFQDKWVAWDCLPSRNATNISAFLVGR